jgi:hypothetical protein
MFDLNRPQGFAKDEYLRQWMMATDTVFSLISKNNNNRNNRVDGSHVSYPEHTRRTRRQQENSSWQ